MPLSNFHTEPFVLNSNNYERIFTSDDDVSSRMNDSIFNTFDNNRNEFNRKSDDISIT